MSAGLGRHSTMKSVANTCGKYFGFDILGFEYFHYLFNQIHSLLTDVVQAAHEGTDYRGAGLGAKQSLIQ